MRIEGRLKHVQTNPKLQNLTNQEAGRETNPKPNSHKYTAHHLTLPCMASMV